MSERSRPAAQRQDRQSRRYGFACANCRRKKARCNGGFPICDRCKTSKETCSFDKAPSVAYAVALENKLKQSEDLLERLRDANDAERPSILKDHFNLGSDASDHPASGDQRVSPDDSTTQSNSSPNDTLELTNEASVDEEGRICFYGKTSLYHIETQPFTWPNSSSTPPSSLTIPSINEPTSLGGSGSFSRELGSNASPMLRSTSTDVWASIMKSGISAELVEELLETYWCWPHHLHRVLCRRIFLRDFSAGGQYATRFLANVILSQAARYSDRLESPGFSDIFAANALQLLPEEIDNGSSIPTIQGLLIFSARECACGRTSQGWLYSGMAFRMMRDMGLHIPPEKLVSQFQPEELALRQQLFWSCYTWDKTMSLCLGRNPNIHDHIPLPSPDHLLDGEEAENEIWRPKFAARSISEGLVAQKARTNTRFVAYCELCIIIDGILDTLYTRPQNRQHEIHQYLKDTMGKLDRWAATLPGHLLIGSQSKAVSCPPLHILLLNLLYQATIILLCRPFRSFDASAKQLATAAAESIDHLFTLHIRRFGFRVITYLESYTMFVAATINVVDTQDENPVTAEAASARLDFSLEVLSNATSTPSSAKCVNIIKRLLRKDNKAATTSGASCRTSSTPQETGNTAGRADVIQRKPSSASQNAYVDNEMSHQLQSEGQCFSTLHNMDYAGATTVNDNGLNMTTVPEQHSYSGNQFSMIEQPMRWLPENVDNDYSWMLTELDLATTQVAYSSGQSQQ